MIKQSSPFAISLINEHGVKKISFTACNSGKLYLAWTSPKVILDSAPHPPPPNTFTEQDW